MFSAQRDQSNVYQGLGISKLISRVVDVSKFLLDDYRATTELYFHTGKLGPAKLTRWRVREKDRTMDSPKEVLKSFSSALKTLRGTRATPDILASS